MWTVKEAAEFSGVSVRTLHYYHKLGLLTPGKITEAGYRLYGQKELLRLRQILLYRELDFPLEQIATLLDGGFSPSEALEKQRELLLLKRERLTRLIRMTERLLEGEDTMNFQEFDNQKLEETRRAYAREAKERWGETQTYREFQKKTAAYEKNDWADTGAEMEEIFRDLAACMEKGPASPEAAAGLKRWQEYITRHFYPCTHEVFQGLGSLYREDPRFAGYFENIAPGLSTFLSDAIAALNPR